VLEVRAAFRRTGCGPSSRRPAHEVAAAIGANEDERVGACAAESAFIAADICLGGRAEQPRALLALRFHRQPARHRRSSSRPNLPTLATRLPGGEYEPRNGADERKLTARADSRDVPSLLREVTLRSKMQERPQHLFSSTQSVAGTVRDLLIKSLAPKRRKAVVGVERRWSRLCRNRE